MDAHKSTTGREIWEQTGGKVTHFCMSSSTGGTIQGVGSYLKEKRGDVEVVLADPEKSRLRGLLEEQRDPEAGKILLGAVEAQIKAEGGGVKVEGAGKEALTALMCPPATGKVFEFVDVSRRVRHPDASAALTLSSRPQYAIDVNDFDAFDACRETAAAGLLVGGSAGANICASKIIAAKAATEAPREGGVTIVTRAFHPNP
jgi:cysteine synthase